MSLMMEELHRRNPVLRLVPELAAVSLAAQQQSIPAWNRRLAWPKNAQTE
jgi:hypothetical protein